MIATLSGKTMKTKTNQGQLLYKPQTNCTFARYHAREKNLVQIRATGWEGDFGFKIKLNRLTIDISHGITYHKVWTELWVDTCTLSSTLTHRNSKNQRQNRNMALSSDIICVDFPRNNQHKLCRNLPNMEVFVGMWSEATKSESWPPARNDSGMQKYETSACCKWVMLHAAQLLTN